MGTSYDLVDVQVGAESVWGTGVAATARLMGVDNIQLTPTVETIIIQSLNGKLTRGPKAEVVKIEGAGQISGALSFEQAPYLFDGLFDEATPSGGGPYTYAYAAPLGAIPTPRYTTLYKGVGTTAVYRLAGAIVNELTIRGEMGAPIMYEASYLGSIVETGSLASLSDASVNYVLPQNINLYIDAFGGTPGTTQITGLAFMSFELKLMSNRVLEPSLGTTGAIGYHDRKFTGSLKLHVELTATTKAYLDAILGASSAFSRIVRLEATRGTSSLTLDFAGSSIEAPEPITEADGLISLDFTLEDTEDLTGLQNWFEAEVVNSVAALP